MANTYTQIYMQFVFAVKNRESLIQADWKDELYRYITGIIQEHHHKLLAINGTSNHIHIFIGYKPHQLIRDLLQDIKASSSAWINKKNLVKGKFSWQQGYGAFSYSKSHIDRVVKYIMNQEQHHKKMTFKEEYIEFLDKFGVGYDVKYFPEDIK
ncbi:MAG: IS200/IS605 family transposase [Bacteroidetes bacterium]|nr:IS200/IS605 family transposase [Bacteroidota bacterium]